MVYKEQKEKEGSGCRFGGKSINHLSTCVNSGTQAPFKVKFHVGVTYSSIEYLLKMEEIVKM